VYSEKPLALSLEDARGLAALAEDRGLYLSGAPSRLLGEPAQTMWKAVREGAIGQPHLAYAEMDDGLLHKMDFRDWTGPSGARWPFQDELEMGCTIEHAGYALTWLAAFFGPAESVTAFSTLVVPDKGIREVPPSAMAPDFSVACVRYRSGVVARLTCSIVAKADHSIRIFGDEGLIVAEDCRTPQSAVHVERYGRPRTGSRSGSQRSTLPLLHDPLLPASSRSLKKIDFCLGPIELAAAIAERRSCRLSARFCCHVAELVLAVHQAGTGSGEVRIQTSFDPVAPMPWAR
jgi:predicted dehydrogenase